MKWALRILVLAGTTVFGLFSICYIAVDTWFYIEIYRLDHRFPIYGLERDLRHHLVPNVLAFAFFGSLYVYLVRKMRPNSN
jgi:hypothetical protein